MLLGSRRGRAREAVEQQQKPCASRLALRRRELIALFGGAAMARPIAARAQQKAMPVIGFLGSSSPGPWAPNVAAFHQGLSETGYIEGQNVAIEYRWAEYQYDRLPALAADLVTHKVQVIATNGDPRAARAAKTATSAMMELIP